MTARFYYTIITDELTVNEIETVAKVYRAYRLQPDTDSDSVSVSTIVTLPSSSSTDAFHDEFADAVWSAVGRFAPSSFHTHTLKNPHNIAALGKTNTPSGRKEKILMKTSKRVLHQALTQIAKTVDPKHSLEILTTLKLKSKDGTLHVFGTDLNNYMTADLPCDGDDIAICILARPLLQLLKPEGKSDNATIEMHQDDDTLILDCDGITRLPYLPASDYPDAEDDKWQLVAAWSAEELMSALKYVIPAASDDLTRPHICAVYFSDRHLVATNGHQLHRANLPAPIKDPMLVSSSTAQLLLNVLKTADQVFIARSKTKVRIQVGYFTIQAKLKEEAFPPYKMVIPKHQPTAVTVETQGLHRALQRIGAISAKSAGCKRTINGVLDLSVDTELGAASVEVPLLESNHQNDVFVAGFNQELLQRSLIHDAPRLTLSVEGPLDPLVITDDRDRLAVVMPMRI